MQPDITDSPTWRIGLENGSADILEYDPLTQNVFRWYRQAIPTKDYEIMKLSMIWINETKAKHDVLDTDKYLCRNGKTLRADKNLGSHFEKDGHTRCGVVV